MSPLITIVIPVYNGDAYLAKTIDSVLNQEYENIECIVVDDGSSDASYEIAQSYGRKLVLIRQTNQGQAAALSAGFAAAKGAYVGYLSADDLIDETLLARLVVFIATLGASTVVVFPMYRTISESGCVIDSECPSYRGLGHMVESFRCNIGPGAIFSREILQTIPGWNTEYKQIPDFEFWLRAARIALFYQLPLVLASFRVHVGSQTFARSTCEKADESIRLTKELNFDWAKEIRTNRFFASSYIYSACLHVRSGRFSLGFLRYMQACRFSIGTALRFQSVKRMMRSMIAWVELIKVN